MTCLLLLLRQLLIYPSTKTSLTNPSTMASTPPLLLLLQLLISLCFNVFYLLLLLSVLEVSYYWSQSSLIIFLEPSYYLSQSFLIICLRALLLSVLKPSYYLSQSPLIICLRALLLSVVEPCYYLSQSSLIIFLEPSYYLSQSSLIIFSQSPLIICLRALLLFVLEPSYYFLRALLLSVLELSYYLSQSPLVYLCSQGYFYDFIKNRGTCLRALLCTFVVRDIFMTELKTGVLHLLISKIVILCCMGSNAGGTDWWYWLDYAHPYRPQNSVEGSIVPTCRLLTVNST